VFGVALFSNHDSIFLTLLQSPSVCNVMTTNFIIRLGEFQFAIISSLILAELKLAPALKNIFHLREKLVILEV
jgi:hypothetical protein